MSDLTDVERRWLWQASFSTQMAATELAVERILRGRLADLAAERDRARNVAVALEQQLARVEALHFPFFWRVGNTSADDQWVMGESDGAERSSSTLCNHCRVKWPCPTLAPLRSE